MRVPTVKRANNLPPIPLDQCLAKSFKKPDGTVLPGRSVLNHCQIVGEVARAMISRMPDWFRAELFPDGSELIAAVHDIGKVSPTFQKKIFNALTIQNSEILSQLTSFNEELERQWGGHAGVSQATLESVSGRYIPEIAGQHHGKSPNLALRTASSEVFGAQAWQDQRLELLAQLKSGLGIENFPLVRDGLQARVLAGLTTVSDWIGSGYLFEDPNNAWQANIEQALDSAGYIHPTVKPGLSFSQVFNDGVTDFVPKETQTKLIETTQQHGVYVLEAPMGLGKTEAALYAAYRLLEKKRATGIYFALPTQLTSDKIHERVNAFLNRILADESPLKKALLVHGNAWLKPFEMGEEGNPGGAWFAQGKRGILAPFAVGTVDQALMAVMNVKHGFVRTFGLAGKVVILDEVHSYDSFTGTILDALVKALRQLQCTVIILSATLTQDRRAKLLGVPSKSAAYPLITGLPKDGDLSEIAVTSILDTELAVSHQDETMAIEEALRRAEEGQQVLWIENTVNEAQERFKTLSARAADINVRCGLLHSRFTKSDRADNENDWVTLYGKTGGLTRGNQGRILVGTQVLEQSLDIDADFLVSRIAPTDMLLQRMGRLWRHVETLRPSSARREAWILSPDINAAIENPDLAFGASAMVYAPYVLCRSLAVWQSLSKVRLPGQIRELIEATYAKREESADMAKHFHQLEKTRSKLERLALIGLSKGGTTLPEESAQTRHSEIESTEVLLIRAYQHDRKRQGTVVTFLNGDNVLIPHNGRSMTRQRWRETSAILTQSTLKVAEYLAPKSISRSQISWLGDYFYLGKPEYEESVMLRIALVAVDESLVGLNGELVNDKYQLFYNATQGYVAKKN